MRGLVLQPTYQEGMLERVFTDRDPAPFVREVVGAVVAGDLDAELVYVKRIRKGALERYTHATPPHVRAARKLDRPAGGVIRYVVTADGPEPVVSGRSLPPGIDRAHAVDHILEPIAEAILCEIGSSFDEVIGRPRQLVLL